MSSAAEYSLPVPAWRCAVFHELEVLGPLLWGLSIGLQLMVASMFCWGATRLPYALPCELAQLLARPEREPQLYVLSIVVTVVIATAAAILWRQFVRRQVADRARFAIVSSVALGLAGLVGMILFLLLVTNRMPWLYIVGRPRLMAEDIESLKLFLPMNLTLLCGLACFLPPTVRRCFRLLPVNLHGVRLPSQEAMQWPPPSVGVSRLRWPDLAFIAILLILLLIPVRSAAALAGRMYEVEALHHWNYFAMGPALAFESGMALGTDVYSQYGVGWPLLYAGLSRVLPLSYGAMISIGTLHSVVYYAGMFLLLKSLLRHRLWAAAGTTLAIYWELGCATTWLGPWLCPSSTAMRHSVDVWFLMALLAWLRSGQRRWVMLAGAALGLGVVFETDTGLYLLPLFVFCSLCRMWTGKDGLEAHAMRKWAGIYALFGAMAMAVLLPLLALASRGTIGTKVFWLGWTECMRTYAKLGIGSLSLVNAPDGTLVCFILILSVYLLVLAQMLLKHLRDCATPEDIFLACVAGYGIMTMLVFVNRSHAWNLYHPLAALAIILVSMLRRSCAALTSRPASLRIPLAMLLLACVLLLSKQPIQEYPNLVRALMDPPPSNAAGALVLPRSMQKLCQQVRALAAQGSVAVVTDDDTVIYSVTGLRPWMRYTPPETTFFQPDAMHRFLQRLREKAPDAVILRNGKSWPDVTAACRRQLAADYGRREQIGAYEIWVRQARK
ncbi:MAG: hypothetical protein ACOYOU_07520 [Kiritimatiellia bacterium]